MLDTASGKILVEFKSEGAIGSVAISRDGAVAACGTVDGSILLWTEAGGQVKTEPFADSDYIHQIAFNASGSLLGVGQRTKRSVAVIDTRTGDRLFEPLATVNGCDGFAFTPDGRHVIVSQDDSKIPMIDMQTGEIVREFEISDWSRGIDLSADGRILALGSGASLEATSGEAYLIDVESGRMLGPTSSSWRKRDACQT